MSVGKSQIPIIQTKFCAPLLTSDIVERGRLLALLDGSLEVPLTLVSAPAGYGKSTLVSQWCKRQKHNTFWLSLDPSDSDVQQCLAYLIADIQKQIPGACEGSEQLLHAPGSMSLEVASSYLLNDLDQLDKPCSIVLDDYHHLALSSPVHELLEKVLQFPPPGIHFTLITRRDPPLQLVRSRAINQLLEIRLDDLRFNLDEIQVLLDKSIGVIPGDDALVHLQTEIEGWAVGLRLISIAMRNRSDVDEFLESIHGGIPQFQEYLMQEVLSGLSADVRDLLLICSQMNRFCADLIEHIRVYDITKSEADDLSATDFIKQLEKENLFTICLDDQHSWFRFHHLFQNLLQQEFQRSTTRDDLDKISLLASQWYESNGYIDEAIFYAIKAGDTLFAARIIERHCYTEFEVDRAYVVKRWLDQIPGDVKRTRPILMLAHTWVLAFSQQIDKVAALIEELELLLQQQKCSEELFGELYFFQGWLFFWQGEFEQSKDMLARAQSSIANHKNMPIAETDLHLAIVLYMNGQADDALQLIDDQISALGGLQLARRIGALAFIHMLSGDLTRLELKARHMLTIGKKMRSRLTDTWSVYFTACVELHRFQLEAAEKHFSRIIERPHLIDRRAAIDSFVGLAMAQQLSGQQEEADHTIERLKSFVRESNEPENLALADSCQLRIGLLQGRSIPATQGQDLSAATFGVFDLFLWVCLPIVTRIRLLIAEESAASLDTAQELLDEVRRVSESCHFIGQLIEIAVLQSVLFEKQDRGEEALDALDQAIELAEMGGWVRPFVEAGPAMAGLLRRFSEKSAGNGFVDHLLTVVNTASTHTERTSTTDAGLPIAAVTALEGEHDSLTNRELDILELLAQRMQNKEIANKLFISTHTVKDHLKHIYQKLGASNRRQAVAKAVNNGVITPQ